MIRASLRSGFLNGHSMSELISILCPTRGRPEFMERLVQSAIETSEWNNYEFIFYIDDDDQDSICLLYTSPSPRDVEESRMPSSA